MRDRPLLLVALLGATAALTSCADYLNRPPPAPGKKLVLADSGNHRVLFYDNPLSTNESATQLIGQTDFNQGQQPSFYVNANTTWATSLARDAQGDLFVSDWILCRVLEFRPPFTPEMDASVVFGQPNFKTRECNSVTDPGHANAGAGLRRRGRQGRSVGVRHQSRAGV